MRPRSPDDDDDHDHARRIGELIAEAKAAGKLKEGRPQKRVSEKPVSLAAQGVDKNLADRARKRAANAGKAADMITR